MRVKATESARILLAKFLSRQDVAEAACEYYNLALFNLGLEGFERFFKIFRSAVLEDEDM